MNVIPANVKRGAQLLDERLPGWRSHVDPDQLDVSSGCRCPLGQIFGDYADGADLLGLDARTEQANHGFMPQGWQTYQQLTEAWRRLLVAK